MEAFGSLGLGEKGGMPLLIFDTPPSVPTVQLLSVMSDDEGDALLGDDNEFMEVYDGADPNS